MISDTKQPIRRYTILPQAGYIHPIQLLTKTKAMFNVNCRYVSLEQLHGKRALHSSPSFTWNHGLIFCSVHSAARIKQLAHHPFLEQWQLVAEEFITAYIPKKKKKTQKLDSPKKKQITQLVTNPLWYCRDKLLYDQLLSWKLTIMIYKVTKTTAAAANSMTAFNKHKYKYITKLQAHKTNWMKGMCYKIK